MDRSTGTAAIYINGKLAAQAAPGVFPTVDAADSISQPLYIGYSPEDPSFRYTGAIDDAAVFYSALPRPYNISPHTPLPPARYTST